MILSEPEHSLTFRPTHSVAVSDTSVALFVAPPLLLDCLRAQLLGAGWQISAASSDGAEAQALVLALAPAVIIVSLHLPPVGGLHVIAALTDARADLRIVALLSSTSSDDAHRALQAGARTWMSSDHLWEAGFATIRAAAVGDVVFSGDLPPDRISRSSSRILSRREVQVLNLVRHGHSVKRIAESLFISPKTVKHHLASIHSKLGVHNRTDAVLSALRRGLLGPSDSILSDPTDSTNQASGCSAAGAPSPFSP